MITPRHPWIFGSPLVITPQHPRSLDKPLRFCLGRMRIRFLRLRHSVPFCFAKVFCMAIACPGDSFGYAVASCLVMPRRFVRRSDQRRMHPWRLLRLRRGELVLIRHGIYSFSPAPFLLSRYLSGKNRFCRRGVFLVISPCRNPRGRGVAKTCSMALVFLGNLPLQVSKVFGVEFGMDLRRGRSFFGNFPL